MGNRAVIATSDKSVGVYLHWNGGRDSVEAFLLYCKLKGYRSPETDNYGWARLCQVIGNFFGGETSVGVGRYESLDTNNWDNGVYIISNWEIIDRLFAPMAEQHQHDLLEILQQINEAQPPKEQLTDEELQRGAEEFAKKALTEPPKLFLTTADTEEEYLPFC